MIAIVTANGAKRLGMPEIEFETVWVDELIDNIMCGPIYYRGEKISSMVSYVDEDDDPTVVIPRSES